MSDLTNRPSDTDHALADDHAAPEVDQDHGDRGDHQATAGARKTRDSLHEPSVIVAAGIEETDGGDDASLDVDEVIDDDEEPLSVDDDSGVVIEDADSETDLEGNGTYGEDVDLERTHAGVALIEPGEPVGEPIESVEPVEVEVATPPPPAAAPADERRRHPRSRRSRRSRGTLPEAPVTSADPIEPEEEDFDEDRTLRPSRVPGGDWSAPAAGRSVAGAGRLARRSGGSGRGSGSRGAAPRRDWRVGRALGQ